MTITLVRGHTHAQLGIMPGTFIANIVGDFIRDRLTEYQVHFNQRTFRNEYTVMGKYAYFDHGCGILHIPIGFATPVKNLLEQHGCFVNEMTMRDYPLRKIDLKVLPEWKDQPHQVELIEKCSQPTAGMKGLAMQTGKGKTYAAIRAICNLGYAAVVIAPGLADQWIESFVKFTGERDEIYKIQEFKSLSMLMQSDWKPKVFVCSVQTMQKYQQGKENYKLLPYSYKEFFEHYGIGTKVVDECHLNFHATVRMDLKSNVPYNLYCSATFGQTNKYAAKIFDVVYPKEIRYGADKYDRYVECFVYGFSGEVLEKKCMRQRGYSHMRYESELLKTKHRFINHMDTMFLPIINQHYINEYQPGNKMLIFCSTIEFIHQAAEYLRTKYPGKSVVEYVGDATRDMLESADIILATVGKAGTGLDIKGLTCAYNTVSLRTPILNSQLLGRLRKINGKNVIYVDRYDKNIGAQMRHAQDRKLALRSMSAKYHEYLSLADPVGIHLTNPN